MKGKKRFFCWCIVKNKIADMSWKTSLTENGINVITDFDKTTILEKVQDHSSYTMNESDIEQQCNFRGLIVQPTSKREGSIESIPFRKTPNDMETDCVFLGTIDSESDPFVQKVLKESFVDDLQCENITYYHGALQKLTSEENKDEFSTASMFINPGDCFESVQKEIQKIGKKKEA